MVGGMTFPLRTDLGEMFQSLAPQTSLANHGVAAQPWNPHAKTAKYGPLRLPNLALPGRVKAPAPTRSPARPSFSFRTNPKTGTVATVCCLIIDFAPIRASCLGVAGPFFENSNKPKST